jgi:adenine C2-methylase RlmN of 23S rRNA A2503 and tRNA A37
MGYEGKVRSRRKAPPVKSILDRDKLEQALDDAGISVKKIHIDALYQALHRQRYPDLPQFVENYYKNESREELGELLPVKNRVSKKKNPNLVNLPKSLLEFLRDTTEFATLTTKIKDRLDSSDNSTSKLIVELWDGQVVESVLMRYDKKGNGRASLCVSSQCGCAMGCTFCATGTMGLSGNLTTGEILEQMIHADHILGEEFEDRYGKENKKKLQFVSNVVFMGMGEPLDNYQHVVQACRAMMDRKRWNLGYGRVTVSTVGLVSQIRKLTKELPEVSLALSLHAPNQDARTAIVPTATRYPIEELIDALDCHMMVYLKKQAGDRGDFTQEERIKESSRRRAMIEYVMRKFLSCFELVP